MRRLLLSFAALVAFSFFLAGCTKEGGKGTVTEPPSKELQEKMNKAQMELINRGSKPAAPAPQAK